MNLHLVAFTTIIRKEVTRFLRIWVQTLLPSVITTTLYLIIFGNFIGSRVQDIHGFKYIDFIIPGIVMMSIITNSYSNVVSSFFSTKFQRNIEEILVSPTPNWAVILGFTCGGVFRGLLVGMIVFLVSIFFTKIHLANILLVFIYAILTAIVFSLAGFLNAIFAKKFDDISIIPTFVLTPLTYLGGVFYSISSLPEFWQLMSMANPIQYMIAGFRYGFLGISELNVWSGLAMVIVLILALFSLNLFLMKRGIGLRS